MSGAGELEELGPVRPRVRGGDLTLLLASALAVLLALAPLPLGGNRPWASSLLSALTVVLLFAGGLMLLAGQRPLPRMRFLLVLGVPWAFAMLWAGAQLMLPPPHAGGAAHELWRLGQAALGPELRPYWTVDRDLTAAAIQLQACYAATFLLALLAGLSDRGAQRIVTVLALAGLAYGLFAIFNHADNQSTTILGWVQDLRVRSQHELRGTFIYRNAFAVCAGLSVLCGAMLLLRSVDRLVGTKQHTSVLLFFAGGSGRNLLLVLAVVVTLSTIVASSSRGGLAATLAAVMVLVLAGQRSLRARHVVPLALAAILLAAALGFGMSVLADRLASLGDGARLRAVIWSQALEGIRLEPLWGWGLGTFRRIPPLFQAPDDPWLAFQAHSTVLEIYTDLGLVAGSALVLPPVLLGVTFATAALRRRRVHYSALGLAVSVLALIQGAVDFTLQMPSLAMWYAALCGLCYAQVELRPYLDHSSGS